MSAASIPVDLFNPGQVFACLGFLEAADVLLGDAEGGFDWKREGNTTFGLRAKGRNPFEAVLEFLAEAEPKRWGPIGYADPTRKKGKDDKEDDEAEDDDGPNQSVTESPILDLLPTFPGKEGDRMALPIRIGGGNRPIVELGHWADGSSRESFKLYAGNRSADRIARAMLKGVRKKATGKQKANGQLGDLKTKGVMQLWEVASTSIHVVRGRRSMPAIRQTNTSIRSKLRPSSSFSPPGGWSMRVRSNSICGKFDMPPGRRACRPCWRAPRLGAASRRFH
jgi:hypothetical protein